MASPGSSFTSFSRWLLLAKFIHYNVSFLTRASIPHSNPHTSIDFRILPFSEKLPSCTGSEDGQRQPSGEIPTDASLTLFLTCFRFSAVTPWAGRLNLLRTCVRTPILPRTLNPEAQSKRPRIIILGPRNRRREQGKVLCRDYIVWPVGPQWQPP